MIQKFYDKIHTIFDGLADNQRVTIYNELGEKLMKDNLLPSQTGKGKGKWKSRGSGGPYCVHVWGYDPNKKDITERILGKKFDDVEDYRTLSTVAKKQGVKPIFYFGNNKRYVVCRLDRNTSTDFCGWNYKVCTPISPEFISPETKTNWKDLCKWLDKHFNK